MSRNRNLWKKLTFALILGLVLIGQASGQIKFGPKTEPFLKTFVSGTYHMKARTTSGGTTAEMDIFSKGDMVSVSSTQGDFSRMIIRDNKMYMIMESQKMILVTPAQNASDTVGTVETEGLVYTSAGTASFAGKNLPYEEYSTKDGSKVQYFIDGNKLAGMRNITPGENPEDVVILALDQNVPDSAFSVPTSGYQIQDMSKFGF